MRIFTILLLFVANTTHAQYIHSHNDYKQESPFYEAVNANAYSMEADVILQNGELYVAHSAEEIQAEKTLESMYLQPLLTLDFFSRVQLLIDIKTDAEETLAILIEQLNKYPSLTHSDQVVFVISGNRPSGDQYAAYPDFIKFDHQSLDDLEEVDLEKIALFSFPYYKYASWRGGDFITNEDSQKLKQTIDFVHSLGFDIRFWATPDTPLAWRTFQQMKIDYINTDKPSVCNRFLNMYK